MVSEAAQRVAGDGVVNTKQLAHLTLADLAMSTDVYCTQGTKASSLSQFLVWPGRDITCHLTRMVSILTHFHPNFPYSLHVLSLATFLAHANPPCPLHSSLNSSWFCCLNQKSALHRRAVRRKQGLLVKLSPRQQKNGSGKAGITWPPRWAAGPLILRAGHEDPGVSLGLPQLQPLWLSSALACRLPYPTSPPFWMGLRDSKSRKVWKDTHQTQPILHEGGEGGHFGHYFLHFCISGFFGFFFF